MGYGVFGDRARRRARGSGRDATLVARRGDAVPGRPTNGENLTPARRSERRPYLVAAGVVALAVGEIVFCIISPRSTARAAGVRAGGG